MLIITITGSSGAGKSTLERKLKTHFGGGKVVTITTRPPRNDECPGYDYHFEDTESLSRRTDLLWKVAIHNHTYAVSESAFYEAAEATGGIAFVSITPERHEFVKDWFTPKGVNTLAVHLKHPGEVELRRRLASRGENPEMIEKRISDSRTFEENALLVKGLHFIEPQDADSTFAEVLKLIESAQQ